MGSCPAPRAGVPRRQGLRLPHALAEDDDLQTRRDRAFRRYGRHRLRVRIASLQRRERDSALTRPSFIRVPLMKRRAACPSKGEHRTDDDNCATQSQQFRDVIAPLHFRTSRAPTHPVRLIGGAQTKR